jgi:hypothetical protein
MFRNFPITCDQCGADATPLRIDIIPDPNKSNVIVDLILWIRCPNCGERGQSAPPDQGSPPPSRKGD